MQEEHDAQEAEISIHAPREGGDPTAICKYELSTSFQSTPPARGATCMGQGATRLDNISIHAPREGGDIYTLFANNQNEISIHAPREGGDSVATAWFTSVRISIHAPREGGDAV